MKWGVLFGWLLFTGIAFAADPDPNSLSYLRDHPEDWPKQVTLLQEASFKIILNGKESGSMTLPPATAAVLVGIGDGTLQISNGSNTATLPAEQTDLWVRVQKIRELREAPGLADPSVKVALPKNSAPAEWYKKQLDEQINPWLEKYPKHSLTPEMKTRKEAFEAEAARVTGGEVRRGEKWFTAAEFAARRNEFAAQDLAGELSLCATTPDVEKLKTLLPQIDKFSKTEVHPQLLQIAEQAIGAIQPPDSSLQKSSNPGLIKNELRALDRLKDAAVAAPREALPILVEVEKLWPGLESTPPVVVEKAGGAVDLIQKSLDASDIAAALANRDIADKLLALPAPGSPALDAIRKKRETLTAPLKTAAELQVAFDAHDYQKILTTEIGANSPGLKKWVADLQAQIKSQQVASSQAIVAAQNQLLHLQISAARASYDKARELWPDNPELATRDRILKISMYVGGLIVFFLILGIWGYLSYVREEIRYKLTMKRKLKELNQRPKM